MNIIIMLILISVLVLVHEFGHFLAARAFGVQVSRFGIGLPIGPTLFEKKCGDTIFTIHAFLLGGYVSFPDDDEKEETSKKEEASTQTTSEDEEKLPVDSPKRFRNKTAWQKAIIVSAGVLANVIFAIVLVMFCAAFYHKLPSGKYNVYIKDLAPNAAKSVVESGIKAGDKILKVNDIDVNSSYQFVFVVQKSKIFDGFVSSKNVEKNLTELKKLNPNNTTTLKLPKPLPEEAFSASKNVIMGLEKYKSEEVALSDIQKNIRNEIENKNSYTLKKGESINDVAFALSDTFKPIKITVERDGKEITFDNLSTTKEGLLGVRLEADEIFIPVKKPSEIIIRSSNYIYENTKFMLIGLWQLICGKIPISEMHGIVAITKVGGDIIENSGMLKGLLLSAIISIDLAIINLLPIPALDGGHLMFLILEKLCGREFDENVVEKISKAFFILLILLMIFVIFNDIFALVTKQL